METRWIWPDSQLFLNYRVAEENIGRSLKNKLIIMTAEIQFFFMSLNETGAAIRTRMWTSSRSFGLPHLLRRRFSMQSSVGSGVKPQQYLSSRSWTFASEERHTKLSSFATDEARARVGIYWKMGQIITICFDFNGVNKCQIGRAPLALQSGSGFREIAVFMEMTQNIMQPKQRFVFFFYLDACKKNLLLAATVRSRWQITIWSDK